jgi:hypothetical protein
MQNTAVWLYSPQCQSLARASTRTECRSRDRNTVVAWMLESASPANASLAMAAHAFRMLAYAACVFSWHGLGNMPSTEAMRLFVKILEV